jgi:hypothetical protein
VDRDEEIKTCQVKAQGAHQIADKREVHFVQVDFTGQMAEFDSMLGRTEENLDEHRQVLAVSLAFKEAEMAKMRMQLVETNQRQASVSGECVMNVG